MRHVDPQFPVFVLLGLLVGETYYLKTLVPRVKILKREHLKDQEVVLHSRDIRKCRGQFEFPKHSAEAKLAFYEALNALFSGARVRLFAVTIDKQRLMNRFLVPVNPYNVSLNQL